MTVNLVLQSREDGWCLRAQHSELLFTNRPAGFRLLRAGKEVLRSGAGWGEPANHLASARSDGLESAVLSFGWGARGLGRLWVTALEDGWRFAWDQPTRDTFDLASGVHWYGQGELIHQGWPLETVSLWEAPFLTWDNGPTGLGDIQTPAWITATGVAILVEEATDALQVGLNAPPPEIPAPIWDLTATQASAADRPPTALPGSSGVLALNALNDAAHPLKYSLLLGPEPDAPSAFRRFVAQVGKPDRTPPEALLREPIWTTWARYKTAIDHATVLAFAREIREHGYPGGTLEIDDKWQRTYGDTELDPARFPDPAGMVRQLNQMGFAVTVWITPFLSAESPNGQQAIQRGYVVRAPDGSAYNVLWWQGIGHLLDLSNPEAIAWWAGRLRELQQSIGLAGFKFDAGEANYLPADALTCAPMPRNEYSARWPQFAADHFPYCEARCGWHSQRQPILFRQWDKFSTWGLDNGLASVATTALALAMSGYPFCLPDMVGGNAYNGVTADKELFVRWTQASAPMPSIQFSLAPWDYDAETVDICRRYARLHVELADDLMAFARQATETGDPIIRPVFWLAPHDAEALTIRDEYLVGDKYLVAPVITAGARQRDIYLPAGTWRDYWSEERYEDGWLRNYPAPLDKLPLFARA